MSKNKVYVRYTKRVLDIFCALLALIVFCWLYGIIALLVRIKLGSPVIFRQERVGKGGRRFLMYKFRTMTDARDAEGNLLPDCERTTAFGNLLRSTSLDELPEAVNILKGDMSVIGPRPLPTRYLDFYTQEERHRHDVRPGLSGYAQAAGRNFISWPEVFGYDLKYVQNCSFAMDVGILFKTVAKLIRHNDNVDFSTTQQDENGNCWVVKNGVRYPVHQPLDVERSMTDVV